MERLENIKEFLLGHKYWVIGGCCIFIILGIVTYSITRNPDRNEGEKLLEEIQRQEENKIEENQEIEECLLIVDIKGEVMRPGLYALSCDSRVQDGINLAGGITDKADTSVINLSKKVMDEMVVIIYSKEQVANFVTTKKEEKEKQEACQNQVEVKNNACISSNDFKNQSTDVIGDTPVKSLISLNTASREELMMLSGIGESIAERIILYRQENGNFQTIEELKNVKGIGDKVFEKIENNITV